jgi:hypothetical protein
MVVTKKALEYNKVIEYCVARGISIIDYRKCYHVSYTQHWINLYNHIIKEVVEVNCLIKIALEDIPIELQFEIFKYIC